MTHILVVDDDQPIRELLKEFLGRLGYEVTTAANGREALLKLDQCDFDCVVSDHMMPDVDGVELLKRLRAQKKKVPFLMITGYPSVETAVEVMKQGAYDYVTKPLELEDVRIKVERALHTNALEKSLKKVTGIVWAVLISVPIWLILGIIFGKAWK